MEETLGKRIVFHRKRLGLTQDALAELMGVTAQAVSKWENDQSCPDIGALPKLAEIFGISTDELLGVERKEVHPAEIVPADGEENDVHPEMTWELSMDDGKKGGIGLAIWILLVGGIMLTSYLLNFHAKLWDVVWPSALLVFGIFGLFPRFSFFRLGCSLFGLYFLMSNLNFAPFRLGREFLLPVLLLLFGGSLLHPLAAQYGAPTEAYRSAVVVQGILYGYQTMDALAALNFGAVIALNIRAQGVDREQDVQRSAIRASLVAGALLLVVYAMLGHTGALTGAAVPGLSTGAEVLTVLAERLFGKAGLVLLAAIFVLACFNTCVGLIACVGEYFHTLLPRIPYPALTAFFAVASMLIANLGLAEILRLSVPVLNALYPVAIMLITLSFVPGLEQRRWVYPLCIGCTAVQSIAAALPLGPLSALANALPLAALGFGWVLPAVAGLLAGVFLSRTEV